MQQIIIGGRLGADPEQRQTPNGQKVWNLRVATNSKKGGQDITTWWSVTVWGDQFDRMMSYFKKGSAIVVNGDFMPPRTYQDKSGETRFALEITARNLSFSPFGKGSEEQGSGQAAGQGGFNQGPSQPAAQSAGFGGNDFAAGGGQTETGMGGDQGTTDDNLPF